MTNTYDAAVCEAARHEPAAGDGDGFVPGARPPAVIASNSPCVRVNSTRPPVSTHCTPESGGRLSRHAGGRLLLGIRPDHGRSA